MDFTLSNNYEQTFVLNNSTIQNIEWTIHNDHLITILDLSPKSNLHFKLSIFKGNVKINYLILALEEQEKIIDYHAINFGMNCSMDICVKVIQFDYSTVIFKCVGEIAKDASNSKSHQRLDFLTFSKNTISGNHPILIINNNQVEAGHAGTVGALDDKYLFYLMSRGIKKSDAIKLVLKSQINAVLTDQSLVNLVSAKIEKKYQGGKHG